MENTTVKFTVWSHGSYCRITPQDYRQGIRKIVDEACICSINDMLSEMERIAKEVSRIYQAEAVFIIESNKQEESK